MKREENEIWKDVIGYEGLYQISNYGNIRSLDRKIVASNGARTINGTTIKPALGRGYHKVTLSKNGNPINRSVHRLVAVHFIPNPENKPCVNHINGVKTDNMVGNLEWCTSWENDQHAKKMNLRVSPFVKIKGMVKEAISLIDNSDEDADYGQLIYDVKTKLEQILIHKTK